MARVSDVAFRSMMKGFEPGLIFSEMLSDKGIVYKNQRTLEMCQILDHEHPIALQLFGWDIDTMVEAAQYLDTNTTCDIIDINMGCPVSKVVKTNGGSSLLKDPEHAYKLVKAIVDNVSKPVSVKLRIGWDRDHINVVEMAKLIEKAGAKLITVHGRTRAQKYDGEVNYAVIRAVKEAVSIPVIGNGDIVDVASARHMMDETGVDGIMMARALLDNPWIIKEIKADFFNQTYEGFQNDEDRFIWLKERYLYLPRLLGMETATQKMRSFSTWYVAGLKNSRKLKSRLIKMNSFEEFDKIVTDYLNNKEEV